MYSKTKYKKDDGTLVTPYIHAIKNNEFCSVSGLYSKDDVILLKNLEYKSGPNYNPKIKISDFEYPIESMSIDTNNNLYVASNNRRVYKFDPNGVLLWDEKIHSGNISKILILNDYILTSSFDKTIAKTDLSGELIWQKEIHNNWISDLIIDSEKNIITVGYDQSVKKLNSNGELIWSRDFFNNYQIKVQIDKNNNIYSLSTNNNITVLSPNGSVLNKLPLGESAVSHFIIDKSYFIYLADKNNLFYKSDILGNKIREFELDGSATYFQFFEDKLIVFTDKHWAYILDANLGFINRFRIKNYNATTSIISSDIIYVADKNNEITGYSIKDSILGFYIIE